VGAQQVTYAAMLIQQRLQHRP